MGSIAVAAWIAKIAFVILLAVAMWSGRLPRLSAAIFLALGFIVWLGLPRLPNGASLVAPTLALLDLALIFALFGRDVDLR
jgi:hypothetical protein